MKKTRILYIHPFWAISPSEGYSIPHLPWGIGVASPIIQDDIIFNPVFTQKPKGICLLENFLCGQFGNKVEFQSVNMAMEIANMTRFASNRSIEERIVGNYAISRADAKKLTQSYIYAHKPDIICMSLHWLVHAPALIRLAEIIKEIDERITVIVGGITASVFFDEILKASEHIDFVIKGDGCRPLAELIKRLRNNTSISSVHNLAYRTRGGEIGTTSIRHFNDADIADKVFDGFITLARTCTHKCCICGGSWFTARKHLNYKSIMRMTPKAITNQLKDMSEEMAGRRFDRMNCNIMFNHDPIRIFGRDRWFHLTKRIRSERIRIRPYIEFFAPTSEEVINDIAKTFPDFFVLNFSPESINRRVRNIHGRPDYDNDALIENIKTVEGIGHGMTNLWFMSGLGFETPKTISDTLSFCRRYASEKTIPHYPPMLYVDPGSLAWHYPQRYGYRHVDTDLNRIICRLSNPYGKQHFNYLTKNYSRNRFWGTAIDISDAMADILISCKQIHHNDRKLIKMYNLLLRKYEEDYERFYHFDSTDIPFYVNIGTSFLTELYSKRLH